MIIDTAARFTPSEANWVQHEDIVPGLAQRILEARIAAAPPQVDRSKIPVRIARINDIAHFAQYHGALDTLHRLEKEHALAIGQNGKQAHTIPLQMARDEIFELGNATTDRIVANREHVADILGGMPFLSELRAGDFDPNDLDPFGNMDFEQVFELHTELNDPRAAEFSAKTAINDTLADIAIAQSILTGVIKWYTQ